MLAAWHQAHAPRKPSPPQRSGHRGEAQDDHLLARAMSARSGATFRRLWEADPTAAPSASEGDLRLLLMLLYWGGQTMDADRLDRLFRRSGRMRVKWDAPNGDVTYRRRTIEAAFQLRYGAGGMKTSL